MIPQFFHWLFRDAAPWLVHLARSDHNWIFPIAFFVAFSESFVGVSFIIPGTFILATLGVVVGASHMGFLPAWGGAVLGAVFGDWISYWLGFHYHHQILHIWPFSKFESQIEKGLHFFHKWGVWAIFIGRFMGPFRATVPIVAGMSEIAPKPFQIANISSAMVWAFFWLRAPGAIWAILHLLPGATAFKRWFI